MPALMAIISGDAKPLDKEMSKIPDIAKKWGQAARRNIATSLGKWQALGAAPEDFLGGGQHGAHAMNFRVAMREALVIVRELSRGDLKRAASSFTILMQALGGLRYLVNPLTIGVIALGGAAFLTLRHFGEMAKQAENLRYFLRDAQRTFVDTADAISKIGEEAMKYDQWERKLGESHDTLSSKLERKLRLMREEGRLMREQAESKGATKAQLAAMEREQLEKELVIATRAKLEAARRAEDTKDEADQAAKIAQDEDRVAKLSAAQRNEAEKKRVLDDVNAKLNSPAAHWWSMTPEARVKQQQIDALRKSPFANDPTIKGQIAALERSLGALEVDVGGFKISRHGAEAAYGEAHGEVMALSTAQKLADERLREAQNHAEKAEADRQKLVSQTEDMKEELAMRDKYPQQGRSNMLHAHVTALQQIGAYSSPAATALIDVNRKMEKHLASINSKIGAANAGQGNFGGVKY